MLVADIEMKKEQRELYFQLKTLMEYDSTVETKGAWVYVIMNKDTIVYIGQTKNLPSRLATHLSKNGKYRGDGVEISCFMIDDEYSGEKDFHLLVEKIMISRWTPSDNIIADASKSIKLKESYIQCMPPVPIRECDDDCFFQEDMHDLFSVFPKIMVELNTGKSFQNMTINTSKDSNGYVLSNIASPNSINMLIADNSSRWETMLNQEKKV